MTRKKTVAKDDIITEAEGVEAEGKNRRTASFSYIQLNMVFGLATSELGSVAEF
jgi:hypothetical protein